VQAVLGSGYVSDCLEHINFLPFAVEKEFLLLKIRLKIHPTSSKND
jgi:hypothetical protein